MSWIVLFPWLSFSTTLGPFAIHYSVGARMMMGAVGKENKVTGWVVEGMVNEACRGFPLVVYETKINLTTCLILFNRLNGWIHYIIYHNCWLILYEWRNLYDSVVWIDHLLTHILYVHWIKLYCVTLTLTTKCTAANLYLCIQHNNNNVSNCCLNTCIDW